jgi:hypothetical protein
MRIPDVEHCGGQEETGKATKWFLAFVVVFAIAAPVLSLVTEGPILRGWVAVPFVVFSFAMFLAGPFLLSPDGGGSTGHPISKSFPTTSTDRETTLRTPTLPCPSISPYRLLAYVGQSSHVPGRC